MIPSDSAWESSRQGSCDIWSRVFVEDEFHWNLVSRVDENSGRIVTVEILDIENVKNSTFNIFNNQI